MNDVLSVLGAPLISAGAAIIVSAIQNRKTVNLIEYKLEELTKKVEKHNSVIDRTYKLEARMDVAETRIDDMEK
jgi:hypothetical protein